MRDDGNRMSENGMTCSKWPQVGLEPWAAAARSGPPYMGHMLYQLSYRALFRTSITNGYTENEEGKREL